MSISVRAAFVLAAVAAAPVAAQRSDPFVKAPDAASIAANARIPLPALDSADRRMVEQLLRGLAHDSMEGRATGTPGAARAARMIAEQMRSVGLQPGGDSGFYQIVPMRMTASVPGGPGGRVAPVPSLSALDTVSVERRVLDRNVIGVIPGTDPVLRDEVILVLSHYDHLGFASRGDGADSIFNGADDDASGTVALLEIGRHLQGTNPKRTIVFATMTGEERGMIGTNYYLANPRFPLDRIAAAFEIEMIGRPDSLAGGIGKAWLTGYHRSTMGTMLQEHGIPIVADARPEQQFFFRSDNAAFARRGIVAHTLSSFNLHTDYHRVSDDVDKVDFDHMTWVIGSAVAAVKHLANDPQKPSWLPGGSPQQPAPAAGGNLR